MTKLEYQGKPKWKENPIEIKGANSVRHSLKLSNILSLAKYKAINNIVSSKPVRG